MDKLEYWFLDSAIKFSVGFSWVIPDEKYGQLAINRKPLGLSTNEIADVLHRLFQKGDLLASRFNEDKDEEVGELILSRSEIEDALEGRLPALYYLTSQGAKRWEAVSKPNWSLYFSVFLSPESNYEVEMIGIDRQLMEKYLSLQRFIDTICWIPGSEVWNMVEPWEALYWKTFPNGHRVIYRCSSNEPPCINDNTPAELAEEIEQALKWHRSVSKWYTDYFEE